MKNKKGYTLTEILIVLSILGILTGIATVSYRGYNESVQKKDLKLHGELFANMVKNCVQGFDGWENPTGVFPCAVPDGIHHTNLKNKLNFTCPADSASEGCATKTNNDKKFFCLMIQKKVSGKILKVITRVQYNNPSNYDIWCSKETPEQGFDMGAFFKSCHNKNTYISGKDDKNEDKVQNMSTFLEKGCANFK